MENAFGQPQNVVVLGGTSEIARAIVRRLIAERVRTVVLAGRDDAALRTAAEEATALGATKVSTVLFDATDPTNAAATVSECVAAVGAPVDLVIMAVGLLADQSRDETDPLAAARVATVNFTWPVAALTAARNVVVAQGAGRILVISSVAAIRVRRNAYLYGSAKAGLDRLAEAMAESLVGSGATLQILRPGFVRTKMTAGLDEQPFAVSAEDVAEATMRGLRSGSRIITAPKVLRPLFGVLRTLPGPLWRKVAARG
jgi:decaprenylphospho-beta-D-erythro-pentofuranosid-2-ulose 2-reductase